MGGRGESSGAILLPTWGLMVAVSWEFDPADTHRGR